MWDLSCVDWRERMAEGRSLVPDLPLNEDEARMGLDIFNELQLPDVPGKPKLGDAAGQWFKDLVAAVFGSWNPQANERYIRDILALAPKGSSKTSYSAGLMLTAMAMNQRPRAEALFIGPTQAISDRAYEQTVGMIEESKDLTKRFRPRDHLKTIEDLSNGSEMKVKTFDLNILTGSILIFALLDELHLLGRNVHTTKVLRQIRGGLDKTPEGVLLITTTQSDDAPAGAFKEELKMARKIRDGAFRGKVMRPTLPLLYEFPEDIANDQAQWADPENWPMVMPNLGRSVHLGTLVPDWESEKLKGEHAVRIWASQHLNIEIGVGLKHEAWAGVQYWEKAADTQLAQLARREALDALLARSECVVVGLDGGGLDDLFGFTALGREPAELEVQIVVNGEKRLAYMKRWGAWSRAWCDRGVLDLRQSIAPRLLEFSRTGELTIVDDALSDIGEIVDLIDYINRAGKLGGVSVDPAGLGELVDALAEVGITVENGLLVGAPQGIGMMNAIKTSERRLKSGMLVHAGGEMMNWCVSNLKIEPTATAIRATKQSAGDAKIDPAMSLFNAVTLMSRNPEAQGGPSVYEERGLRMV